jgi:hypothetical protein
MVSTESMPMGRSQADVSFFAPQTAVYTKSFLKIQLVDSINKGIIIFITRKISLFGPSFLSLAIFIYFFNELK